MCTYNEDTIVPEESKCISSIGVWHFIMELDIYLKHLPKLLDPRSQRLAPKQSP